MPCLRCRLVALSALAAAGCPDAPSYKLFPGLGPTETKSDLGADEPTTEEPDPTDAAMATTTGDEPGASTASDDDDSTTFGETSEPPDQPPTVQLMLDPETLKKAGPVALAIEVSDDVVLVDVVYKGAVAESLSPAKFPHEFAVTSQLQCDGEQTLGVVVHDGEGLTASDDATLTCQLPAGGSEVAQLELPGVTASVIHGVAALADGFVAVGALDDRMIAWHLGPDLTISPGWPKTLGAWTGFPGLANLPSVATAVTIDPDGNIVIAGNFKKDEVIQYYVGKLNAEGSRISEAQGLPHEEAAGVAVATDGTIVVVGRVRANELPAFDWAVWGHKNLGKATPWTNVLPLGPDEQPDDTNVRSERARAAAALTNGEFVVVGEREYLKIDTKSTNTRASWQRYTTKGERVGPLWTSPSAAELHDAANAVVVLPDGSFAITGWKRSKPGLAPELMSRRFVDDVLQQSRFELEVTAEGKGIAHDREGKLIVAAELTQTGQLDAWAFAFGDWALPRVWSQPPFGEPKVWDTYNAVACTEWGYCLTGGFLTKGTKMVGFLRLHNP